MTLVNVNLDIVSPTVSFSGIRSQKWAGKVEYTPAAWPRIMTDHYNNGAANITSGAKKRSCRPPNKVLAYNTRTNICKGARGMNSFLLWSMLCLELCQHLYKMSRDLCICLFFLPCSLSLGLIWNRKQSLLKGIHGPNAVLFEDQGRGITGLLWISMWLIILSWGVNTWRPSWFLGFTQHMLLTPAASLQKARKYMNSSDSGNKSEIRNLS